MRSCHPMGALLLAGSASVTLLTGCGGSAHSVSAARPSSTGVLPVAILIQSEQTSEPAIDRAPPVQSRGATAVTPHASVLRIPKTAPAQRVVAVRIGARADGRLALVRSGGTARTFATVPAVSRRLHALVAINGFFSSPPRRSPLLVRHGSVVAPRCASLYCVRNPRTGFGITRNGFVLLVVADGRQDDAAGMRS